MLKQHKKIVAVSLYLTDMAVTAELDRLIENLKGYTKEIANLSTL